MQNPHHFAPTEFRSRSVLMVGTDLDGKGGVRAVVRGYFDGGLFDRIYTAGK